VEGRKEKKRRGGGERGNLHFWPLFTKGACVGTGGGRRKGEKGGKESCFFFAASARKKKKKKEGRIKKSPPMPTTPMVAVLFWGRKKERGEKKEKGEALCSSFICEPLLRTRPMEPGREKRK